MGRFRVNIDGAVYEGSYGSMPDAVYGAILKHYNDFDAEWPREGDSMPPHPANDGPWLIGAEEIPQRGAPRGKAKRVG